MSPRLIPLFVLILGFGIFSDARMPKTDDTAERITMKFVQNEKICSLCEQFTVQALEYLSQNKSQQQIVDDLHVACSGLHSFEKQCVLLVDHYLPLFFLEVETIDSEVFCEKVKLCERVILVSQLVQDQACDICQNTVAQILNKLKDPETQLDIIQVLLKACDQFENYTQQCKRLVFEYGPVILVNAEKILETTDICSFLRVCKENEVLSTFPAETSF